MRSPRATAPIPRALPTRSANAARADDPIPTRNGEPFGELGLVLQKDFAWQSQTGAPADPQAGNIPGGPRDVLRSAGFQDGSMEGFFVDTGKFSVQNGALKVAADSTWGDAVAVYHVGDALPGYFEVTASVSMEKPTGGWKANAYVMFDYVDDSDFKFAGIDVSSNKLVIGHRASWGWAIDKQTPFQGKWDTAYNLLVAVNGANVTVVVDNNKSVTHTFQPRVVDGFAFGLNYGLIGVGSDAARGSFDNVAVLVVPPASTFQNTENFADGIAQLMPAQAASGNWQVASGRYSATGLATSLIDLGITGLQLNSVLELSAKVNTQGRAGFVFDRYSAEDFKFAAIDAATDQVIIGHYQGGWVTDAAVAKTIDAGTDYTFGVTLQGSKVSVTLNGVALASKVFNAVVVDGDFGLLAASGQASFDDVKVKTNDPAFIQTTGSNMVADAPALASGAAAAIMQSDVDAATVTAMSRWTETLGDGNERLAGFGNVWITLADLGGSALGYTEGRHVWIDRDAAGYGWSAGAEVESGRMDLVTVMTHELGNLIGLRDNDPRYAVMHEDLAAGERYSLMAAPPVMATLPGAAPAAPKFDLDAGPGTLQPVEWKAWDTSWGAAYPSFASTPEGQKPATNFSDFLVKLAATAAAKPQAAGYDSLGKSLLGAKKAKL